MPYCPNCNAALHTSKDESCWNCDASFTAEGGWRALDRPAGKFRVRKKPSKSTEQVSIESAGAVSPEAPGDVILRWLLGLPILLLGAGLMIFAAMLGRNGGELAFFPAVLYIVVGLTVLNSRSVIAKLIATALLLVSVKLLTSTLPTK